MLTRSATFVTACTFAALAAGCDVGSVEPSRDAAGADDAASGTPDGPAGGPDGAAAAETLSVQFEPTPTGGNYAPKHIVAVWIENAGGAFEQTIGRWAGERVDHLVAWVEASGLDADAISGATRASHTAPLTVTWDLRSAGAVVPDGAYTIRMELADSNADTAAENHQGTFTFDKDGTAVTQEVAGGGFLNVTIDYSGR